MDLIINPPPIIKEKNGKTTITFRILPTAKITLSKQAQSLGSSLSEYIEILALNRHNEIINTLAKPPEVPLIELSESDKSLFKELLSQLQLDYEGFSEAEIVLACLVHAKENKGAFWQRSLSTFLTKIKSKFYHSKSQNHDD